ncbi:DUF6519 domain-containing protein [Streptomyces anthocyanicus]|uniref:DUF6519 domain-containing protein n=1 Tax=Streptomyces anthocyanicus TaxID=68174 RepID=UPI0036269AAC
MATDVTRTSYDPARRYTGVVVQQGRISLDAEANEQSAITAGERLEALVDVVGPAGTPDGGYALSAGPSAGFDLTVGPGTMYVGGVRVGLDAPVRYSDQPDWLDAYGDPRFTPVPERDPEREHVFLELTEYPVTATEDPMLRDPALGGVDGAARLRIVQRVRRLSVLAGRCADALDATNRAWADEGLVFRPDTMRLESASRLQVEFDGPATAPNPCDPAAAGGYLGADNQNIRVQVSHVDPVTGTFDLLWGWDNASFLYRVTSDDASPPTLTLDRSPVDTYHHPRTGQAVQVLRAAASLTAEDGRTEGWAAALTGESAVLTSPYDPDTRAVALPAPLPAAYLDPDRTPQLYLRVWEGLCTGITPGTAVTLPGTGVRVRVTVEGGLPVHRGAGWSFAVRPATPDGVLPTRLLRAPQPPDGPRMWACPLAVIDWPDDKFRLLEDCRRPFAPLVDVSTRSQGCCTVTITPEQARGDGLQRIIDQVARSPRKEGRDGRITICLRPGRYVLDQPLVFTREHSALHLEGCGDGVVLDARGSGSHAFGQGMIVVVGAWDVRISGIEFRLPLTPPDEQGSELLRRLVRSIGVRPVNCHDLTISRCAFVFLLPRDEQPSLGVGVFAGGICDGLVVTDTAFECRRRDLVAGPPPAPQAVVGVLVSSTVIRGEPRVVARLGDMRLRDNVFSGLSGAVVAVAVCSGTQVIDGNRADRCHDGVLLGLLEQEEAARERKEPPRERASAVDALLVAVQYPLPDQFTVSDPVPPPEQVPSTLMVRDNRIECVPVPDDRFSGTALLVLGQRPADTEEPASGSALVHGNQLSGLLPYPVAVLEDMHGTSVTITGNVVSNLHAEGKSLQVDGSKAATAVTGNVLKGTADFPGRLWPAPLNTWLPFNAGG